MEEPSKLCLFTLAGPNSSHVMANLNLVGQPNGTNRYYSVGTITSCTTGRREIILVWATSKEERLQMETLTVGDKVVGTVVDVPFPFRHCPPPKSTNP